jgi:hypothetical protein
LSYAFRDRNPTNDSNQKLIDYYIKPLLEILDIEPVTARSHLKSQDLIDDDVIALVKECDGIIGFYTFNDPITNIEHEVAHSRCNEEGAESPKMRKSRLQINFTREETGRLVLTLPERSEINGCLDLKPTICPFSES